MRDGRAVTVVTDEVRVYWKVFLLSLRLGRFRVNLVRYVSIGFSMAAFAVLSQVAVAAWYAYDHRPGQ